MNLYVIPLYVGLLRKKVKFTYVRYLIQSMGVCFDPFIISVADNANDEQNKKKIMETFHSWKIADIVSLQEHSSVYVVLVDYKWSSISENPGKTDHERKMRYFINVYSPWFGENETVDDLYSIEMDDIEEEIDVCTYVLDVCDHHHIFNHHLKDKPIVLPDNRNITLYSIFEHLITE